MHHLFFVNINENLLRVILKRSTKNNIMTAVEEKKCAK